MIKGKVNAEIIYPRAGATADELLADSAFPVDVRCAAENTTGT